MSEPQLKLNRTQIILLVLVIVVVAGFCSRSLWNGFVRDDIRLIVNNRMLGSWSSFFSHFLSPPRAGGHLFFRPAEGLWYHMNFAVVGRSTMGWHAIKVLLHLSVVLLVFGVVRSLSGSIEGALFAAVLFGLLPAHDEAIAWVTTPEALAAALELAAFWIVIRRAQAGSIVSLAAMVLSALAMFAFEGAIVFPLLVFLYFLLLDGEPLPSDRQILSVRRLIRATKACVPFVLVAILYLACRLRANDTAGLPYLSAQPLHQSHPTTQVLATIPAVLLGDLALVIMPWMSGPVHPVRWAEGFGSAAFLRPLGVQIFAVSAFLLAIWRRPRRNLYLFAVLWFFICLIPMLNLNYVEKPVQDRWTYLSSMGWCVLLAEGFMFLERQKRMIAMPALALVVGLLAYDGIRLWHCEYYWRSDEILVNSVGEFDPDSPEFLRAEAFNLETKGDWKAAKADLLKLIRLQPDKPLYHFYLFRAEAHLGNADAARAELKKAQQPHAGE